MNNSLAKMAKATPGLMPLKPTTTRDRQPDFPTESSTPDDSLFLTPKGPKHGRYFDRKNSEFQTPFKEPKAAKLQENR
jgi:hypothetical protein